MLKPIRLNPRLRDPLQLQQLAKYQGNLTVTSNDTNIVPRDDAGNVRLETDSESNPLLIIEPVATRITLNSVLKVLDTQFQYFKFPATVRVIDDTEVDVDLTIPELEDIPEQDLVYARYRPSEARIIPNGTPGAFDEASKFSGILIDFVEEGAPQKQANSYQITKEIKESGIDLRFRIKIEHRYDSISDVFGNAYFSIIKNSPKTGLNRLFKGPFANQSNEAGSYWGAIGRYEIQNLNLDIIINNSEFDVGDYFGIGATADPQTDTDFHTINAVQTYWSITDASKNVDEWNQEIR